MMFSVNHDRSRLLFIRRAQIRAWLKHITKIQFNYDHSLYHPSRSATGNFFSAAESSKQPSASCSSGGEGL